MVADFLEMDGWNVQFLGSNTPASSLVKMVQEVDLAILMVSVGMPFNLVRTGELVSMIHREAGERRPKIIVGGLAFMYAPDAWRKLGADAVDNTPEEAVSIASELAG